MESDLTSYRVQCRECKSEQLVSLVLMDCRYIELVCASCTNDEGVAVRTIHKKVD